MKKSQIEEIAASMWAKLEEDGRLGVLLSAEEARLVAAALDALSVTMPHWEVKAASSASVIVGGEIGCLPIKTGESIGEHALRDITVGDFEFFHLEPGWRDGKLVEVSIVPNRRSTPATSGVPAVTEIVQS